MCSDLSSLLSLYDCYAPCNTLVEEKANNILQLFCVHVRVGRGGGRGGLRKLKIDQSFIYFVFIYLSICVNLLL